MTFEQVRFPTRDLIFRDISMRGFWMDRWYRQNPFNRVQIMFDKVFDLMREGVVYPQVAETYPLADYKKALAAAARPRLGKVLFKIAD
jgi:trans-2-enoyl-CoA reductase